MRIPHTISRNVVAAYRCSPETSLLPQEQGRTLRAEDVSWDDDVIPDLKILALRTIVSVWKDNPVLEDLPTCVDRDVLLETLPTDLPFELTIPRIEDEFYWERAAKDRWEHNDPGEHGGSWRRLYCERHLAEYLETLQASYFESQKEECEKLMALVKNHIHVIRLRSLVPTKQQTKQANAEDDESTPEEDVPHHIPMAVILPQFPHLTEIYLNFGMIYMNDGFEWRDFEFSLEDCLSLGEGITASPTLKKVSLTRNNLDQPRVAAILQGMASNDNIEELDLSHCKLADTGAHAVGEFLSMHRKLRTVHLANNIIGPNGIAGIVHGLIKASSSALKNLDLRLNPLQSEGANHICALLVRNQTLETLNISGCELGPEDGIAIAGVLSSGCVELQALSLDVSNNNFGFTAGESFEAAVGSCPYIIHLDGRMCNFSKESECSITESAHRNKQNVKKEKDKAAFSQNSNVYNSPSAKNPQQQPEVGSSFPEPKDIVQRFSGRQIDTGSSDQQQTLRFEHANIRLIVADNKSSIMRFALFEKSAICVVLREGSRKEKIPGDVSGTRFAFGWRARNNCAHEDLYLPEIQLSGRESARSGSYELETTKNSGRDGGNDSGAQKRKFHPSECSKAMYVRRSEVTSSSL